MAASRKRGGRRLMGEINVVPYIDVMLVLLIIFMVTAPLLTQGVEVEPPKAEAEGLDSGDREPVVLTVDRSGNLYLNIGDAPEIALTEKQVTAMIGSVMKNQPDTKILVRGDRDANYGTVVKGMVLLDKAGVPQVGLVTETPDSEGN